MPGEMLLSLMLRAPLVGVRQRWPQILHAIPISGLPLSTWPDGKCVSACGKCGLRLLTEKDGLAAPWPPRLNTVPDGWTRCRDCYVATGKPRPRSEFALREA